MLFNSFSYLLFFPIVCIIYYLLPFRFRWLFLLIASYYFYMNWEPIYAVLIFSSTLITYSCSYMMDMSNNLRKRKALLLLSIISNFGILFIFKYYNFLTESIYEIFNFFGARIQFPEFSLLLPVGISFYTFQAVGYSIDVYQKKLKHETHFGKYALFVSFFPQLVAGPIERATNLLPQFSKKTIFSSSKAIEGTKIIIWGYFMKVVVADRLSIYVDSIYNNSDMHSSLTLITATFFFSIQIYCDFAGYSNIAIGSAKILGFDLMTNFRRPYFSKTCAEFWRRWHISLSTWFKDYVYIPLGGSQVKPSRKYFNLLVTFLVSGLWHGANWTFVIWGGLNGIYQISLNFLGLDKPNGSSKIISLTQILGTFILINITWIFFRADTVDNALSIINRILAKPGPLFIGDNAIFAYSLLGILILFLKDLYDELDINISFTNKKLPKYFWYSTLIILILMIGVFDGGQFIYFQF